MDINDRTGHDLRIARKRPIESHLVLFPALLLGLGNGLCLCRAARPDVLLVLILGRYRILGRNVSGLRLLRDNLFVSGLW
jgi:hypothetical protein